MRIGVGFPLALALHAMIAAGAYFVFPNAMHELDIESVIVPIEIVEVSDTTNLRAPQPDPVPTPDETPVVEDTPEPEAPPPLPEPEEAPDDEVDELGEEEETAEAPETEPEPEPEPEPAEPEPTPEETPEPKPIKTPEQVQPEPKPTVNEDFLNSVLKSAQEKKEQRTAEREAKQAADLKAVQDANKSTRSAGDRQRDTATWNDLLRSKLNTCWRDPSDMANAERLRVSYKIIFNRDGSLQRPPQRLKPAQISAGDQQMLVFDINAVRAIQKCAPYDDIFPPELYEEWKEFTFNFGIAIE